MCYNFLQNENDCGDFSACMDRSKSCNGKNYTCIMVKVILDLVTDRS